MKLAVAVLTIICSCSAFFLKQTGTQTNVPEYVDLLTKFQKVYFDHLLNDDEFRAALNYQHTPQFKQKVTAFLNSSTMKKIAYKLEKEFGCDINVIQAKSDNFIELKVPHGQNRSFRKFFEDLQKELNINENFLNKLQEIVKESEFKIHFLKGQLLNTLFDKVISSSTFYDLACELKNMDFPIEDMVKGMYFMFDWELPAYSIEC